MAMFLVFVIAFHVWISTAGNCPDANPNDNKPDDSALQACLNRSSLLVLDPGAPGYIIADGLIVALNGTRVTSSASPAHATLVADAMLAWPMIMTDGVIDGLTLEFLDLDGNRDHRNESNTKLCSSQSGANNDNYRTSTVMLPGFRFPDGSWRCWDPWSRFVSNVVIQHCKLVGCPCGAAIGISGRDYVIRDSEILDSGWDQLHNPQKLGFPYADGINAAVCYNGTIERNNVRDATNMMMAIGPGPYCLVQDNTLLVTHSVALNGINVWPTNVWLGHGVFWHPMQWDFLHSALFNNTITVEILPDASTGMYSGIAIGGLPWSPAAWVLNAGAILQNKITGANVGVLVDGVTGGTVFGNRATNPYQGGGSASMCRSSHAFTVADTNGTMLEPGYEVIGFESGQPCHPTGQAITSTVDNAAFLWLEFNGQLNPPQPPNVRAGDMVHVSLAFANRGSSLWQSVAGELGYKLGDMASVADPTAAPWGLNRAILTGALCMPGATAIFNLTLVAPLKPGLHSFQWQMVQELVGWFGEPSPASFLVNVVQP